MIYDFRAGANITFPDSIPRDISLADHKLVVKIAYSTI
jgi:hypothetical protein